MKNKKVSIITLGCKTNQYESDAIMNSLLQHNISVVQGLSFADYYIINSCAVTNEAEKKSRGIIAKVIKLNPNAKIFVCGCASTNNPKQFQEKENVVSVIGTAKKLQIVDEIINDNNNENMANLCPSDYYEDYFVANPTKTRSIIKIQDGCNNFCSYCLIPYVRGRERSRKLEDIKKEIDFHSKAVGEIVFTGINASSWGNDFENKLSLIEIAKLCKNYSGVRFRFSSLEMHIITEDFLKVVLEAKNICEHFHLSLQSGNNNVLNKMNRKYSIEEFSEKVQLIRKYFPLAGITTDIIVGFPTESDSDFEDGINNIKKLNFSDIHIFPYSKRDGTLAASWKKINGLIVKQRQNKLELLKKELVHNFKMANLGKTNELQVESYSSNECVGYSSNYIKCYLKSDKDLTDQILKVQLKSIYKDGIICELV